MILDKCQQHSCSDFQAGHDADLGPSEQILVQAKEDRAGERIAFRMSKGIPRNRVS